MAADSVVNGVKGVDDFGASFALIDPEFVDVAEGIDGAQGLNIVQGIDGPEGVNGAESVDGADGVVIAESIDGAEGIDIEECVDVAEDFSFDVDEHTSSVGTWESKGIFWLSSSSDMAALEFDLLALGFMFFGLKYISWEKLEIVYMHLRNCVRLFIKCSS